MEQQNSSSTSLNVKDLLKAFTDKDSAFIKTLALYPQTEGKNRINSYWFFFGRDKASPEKKRISILTIRKRSNSFSGTAQYLNENGILIDCKDKHPNDENSALVEILQVFKSYLESIKTQEQAEEQKLLSRDRFRGKKFIRILLTQLLTILNCERKFTLEDDEIGKVAVKYIKKSDILSAIDAIAEKINELESQLKKEKDHQQEALFQEIQQVIDLAVNKEYEIAHTDLKVEIEFAIVQKLLRTNSPTYWKDLFNLLEEAKATSDIYGKSPDSNDLARLVQGLLTHITENRLTRKAVEAFEVTSLKSIVEALFAGLNLDVKNLTTPALNQQHLTNKAKQIGILLAAWRQKAPDPKDKDLTQYSFDLLSAIFDTRLVLADKNSMLYELAPMLLSQIEALEVITTERKEELGSYRRSLETIRTKLTKETIEKIQKAQQNAKRDFVITLPEGTENINFVTVGCAGSGNERQKQAAKHMAEWIKKQSEGSKPVIVLGLGDTIYEFGPYSIDDSAFQKYFYNIYYENVEVPLEIPSWLILGNHDLNVHSKNMFMPFYPPGLQTGMKEIWHSYYAALLKDNIDVYNSSDVDLKKLPNWNLPQPYYSLTFTVYKEEAETKKTKDTVIYCLDSTNLAKDFVAWKNSKQIDNQISWLINKYAEDREAGKNIIVAMHHPLMTIGKERKHDARQVLNKEEIKQCKKWGLDTSDNNQLLLDILYDQLKLEFNLVLSAHDHFSDFVVDKEIRYPSQAKKRLFQLVAGGGGGKPQNLVRPKPAQNFRGYTEELTFADVSIPTAAAANHLKVKFHTVSDKEQAFNVPLNSKCLGGSKEQLTRPQQELRTSVLKLHDEAVKALPDGKLPKKGLNSYQLMIDLLEMRQAVRSSKLVNEPQEAVKKVKELFEKVNGNPAAKERHIEIEEVSQKLKNF